VLWDEDHYIGDYPTIFEILRANNIAYETIGLFSSKKNGGALSHIEQYHPTKNNKDWIYLFIGETDQYSHFYTQESAITINFLRRMDREIERVCQELSRDYDEVHVICFSDHGHMKVEQKLDIYDLFSSYKASLNDFIHIIDTNYARFWFRNLKEERSVRDILRYIPNGFILDDYHYAKYNTVMPDNRYGDLIYYLDYPYVFKRTVWGYSLRTKSIHGYLPDYDGVDGVFVTNLPIRDVEYITLADIAPSILCLLNVSGDFEFDGHAIWE
jgi:predicted AlkP superfamily pyrophosphatase or phosphodiesterase